MLQLDDEFAVHSPDIHRRTEEEALSAIRTGQVETRTDAVVSERYHKSYLGARGAEPSWVQEEDEPPKVRQGSISSQSSAQSSKRNSIELETEDAEGLRKRAGISKVWKTLTRQSRDSGIGSDRGSWNPGSRDKHQSVPNPVRKFTRRIRSTSRAKSMRKQEVVKELSDHIVNDLQKTLDTEETMKFRLKELLDFESHYLTDLGKIVRILDEMQKSRDDPNHPVPMPAQLREGRDLIVSSNFYDLHRLHRY